MTANLCPVCEPLHARSGFGQEKFAEVRHNETRYRYPAGGAANGFTRAQKIENKVENRDVGDSMVGVEWKSETLEDETRFLEDEIARNVRWKFVADREPDM